MRKKLIVLAAALTLALSWSMTVCAQPEVMPDGTVFDAEYYAQANPDVAAVLGTDANALYLHYVNFGKTEGRAATAPTAEAVTTAVQTTEEFDAEFYALANPDVAAALGTNPSALYQHYIQYGKAEGRLAAAQVVQIETDYARQVMNLVNVERSAAGLPALSWDNAIANAANVRAVEVSQLFDHTRPDGRSCFTALEEQGISNGYRGENIAAGYTTPEAVMTGWMNSQGHRENILRSQFKRIGVGYYVDVNGRANWVQMFAS